MNIGSYAKGETLRNVKNKPIPIRKFIERTRTAGPPPKDAKFNLYKALDSRGR